ncbi:hypothetical protein Fmac_000876 [Flemingia macrophylla]|uniref:Uncharacterized protein n=1 Tax=Flemingia macrophylla TaxID=520843 RepID=A0ABD1NG00_9FABA
MKAKFESPVKGKELRRVVMILERFTALTLNYEAITVFQDTENVPMSIIYHSQPAAITEVNPTINKSNGLLRKRFYRARAHDCLGSASIEHEHTSIH